MVDRLRPEGGDRAAETFEVARFKDQTSVIEIRLPARADADLAADFEFGALDVAAFVLEFLAGELQTVIEKRRAQALDPRVSRLIEKLTGDTSW